MPKDPCKRLFFTYGAAAVGFILFVALLAIFLGGCQVLKKKSSVVKDSAVVNRVDSGNVRKTETTAKDSLAWWREIVNFLPQRDTVINNVTTPVTNYYPSQIIREGGVRTSEVKQVNYDSLWNNRLDSLVARFAATDKSKETKFLTQFQIWAVIGLLGLFVIKNLLKR